MLGNVTGFGGEQDGQDQANSAEMSQALLIKFGSGM